MEEPASIVACLGSSSTAGKGQAFNWIGELQNRLSGRFIFHNFGVGGDLSYNALQRLASVLTIPPDKLVVLIGGNDALAMVFPKARSYYHFAKRLPRAPTIDWFAQNIREIVRRSKGETKSAIGLCSLPPIGEDPSSTNPSQSHLNQAVAELSSAIKQVSSEESVDYIPLYETMLAEIQKSPGKAFIDFGFVPFYRDAFRTLVLGKSPDEVAQLNGWRFHTDSVHLNSRAGLIIADLVQKFLEEG